MKRSRPHVLEDESKRALKALLPSEWITRNMVPDYGIDLELTIVEGEEITNKVLWLQLKATDKARHPGNPVSKRMGTQHLKYYETCRLPVLIMYWIKPENVFYYVFAQSYIRETLSPGNPRWRNQKTVTVTFPPGSRLDDVEELSGIATEGHMYLIQQQLQAKAGGAVYWLDGIPQSDSEELKERTLRALCYLREEQHPAAIDELETILRVCTLSPSEKMSILLNLGNAYYSLSQNDQALRNYRAILDSTPKVSSESALQGQSAALGNIGLIYSDKGEADTALHYHQDTIKIDRKIGYKQGEANQLGNIGLIYFDKGEADTALQYLKDSLKIHREIGYKQGEASALGNIGLIYRAKGEADTALQYLKDALKIHREIGYKQGEASQLGNIGLIYRAKGEADTALQYLKDALKIHREIGYKQGEASDLGNIGPIYSAKGEADTALHYLKDALKIHREIGYKQGEAADLGNIGLIYRAKGETDTALQYHQDALKIHREIGHKQGEANQLGNIGLIYFDKGEADTALQYLKDAIEILDRFGLVYGREIIRNAITFISAQ